MLISSIAHYCSGFNIIKKSFAPNKYTKKTNKSVDKGIRPAAKKMAQFSGITCLCHVFWANELHQLFPKK